MSDCCPLVGHLLPFGLLLISIGVYVCLFGDHSELPFCSPIKNDFALEIWYVGHVFLIFSLLVIDNIVTYASHDLCKRTCHKLVSFKHVE